MRFHDRIGAFIDSRGWLFLKHNGNPYPGVPLDLPQKFHLGLELPLANQDSSSKGVFIRNVPQWQIEQDIDMVKSEEIKNLLSYQRIPEKAPEKLEADEKLEESEKLPPLVSASFKKQIQSQISQKVQWDYAEENFQILENQGIVSRRKSAGLIRRNFTMTSKVFEESNQILRVKLERTKQKGIEFFLGKRVEFFRRLQIKLPYTSSV